LEWPYGSEAVLVPVCKIEDLVGDRDVHFIKADIEGSEFRALQGASGVISKNMPTILIELNEVMLAACGSNTKEVKSILFDHGYSGVNLSTGRA
jgi:hypothetical protein